jgi:hypothetical protein
MTEIHDDPHALNPLLEIETRNRPNLVEIAKTEAPVPTMWATGDLPPFTASGIDPEMLRYVPWQARHAAAAEPDKAKVLGMIDNFQGAAEQDIIEVEHEGLAAYRVRMQRWMAGFDKPKDAPMSQQEQDDLYEKIYGKK